MIAINGKKFAKDDAEFTSSLFDPSGTCVGYYKRAGKAVRLMDMQRNLIGVINAHKVLCCADKLDNGKTWYSLATIKLIGEFPSYAAAREEISAAYENA